MRTRIALVLAAALLMSSAGAPAQSGQDHAAHHPAGAAASGPKAPAAASTPTAVQMDAQMRSMHEMHDKMMAARSPEERQALMADHMKAMQDGMSMMGRMQGGRGMGGSQREMTERRMDMMQMMMQMMMDREGGEAPVAR